MDHKVSLIAVMYTVKNRNKIIMNRCFLLKDRDCAHYAIVKLSNGSKLFKPMRLNCSVYF